MQIMTKPILNKVKNLFNLLIFTLITMPSPFILGGIAQANESILIDPSNSECTSENIPNEVLESIQNHIASNGWPNLYYDVLPKIIKQNHFKTIVEIGVALGGHAERILTKTNVHYIGVDPYLYNYDLSDAFNQAIGNYSNLGGQTNFDYLYQWVKDFRLKPFDGRYQLIRNTAVAAAPLFDDESIDCIFVDGDHRYQGVLDDLSAWYPKLKKDGLMLGDDYWMNEVAMAVNDFFKSENKQVSFVKSYSGYKIWSVRK